MQGEPVHDPHAESEVVGRYKVYFCCPPCREPFDKLGAEEKARRIHAALKKQEGGGLAAAEALDEFVTLLSAHAGRELSEAQARPFITVAHRLRSALRPADSTQPSAGGRYSRLGSAAPRPASRSAGAAAPRWPPSPAYW